MSLKYRRVVVLTTRMFASGKFKSTRKLAGLQLRGLWIRRFKSLSCKPQNFLGNLNLRVFSAIFFKPPSFLSDFKPPSCLGDLNLQVVKFRIFSNVSPTCKPLPKLWIAEISRSFTTGRWRKPPRNLGIQTSHISRKFKQIFEHFIHGTLWWTIFRWILRHNIWCIRL